MTVSETADNDARGLTTNQRMEFRPVHGDSPGRLHAGENLLTNNLTQPEAEFSQGSVIPKNLVIPTGIFKLTELTLDQLKKNFRLFAQKLVNVDLDLVIRKSTSQCHESLRGIFRNKSENISFMKIYPVT